MKVGSKKKKTTKEITFDFGFLLVAPDDFKSLSCYA